MAGVYFDEEFKGKVDRFALDLVKGYRRYVAGEGYATEEANKLFGCSVFAHYLAKCNHTQKILREKGIPTDEDCVMQRHHFFLCTGSVYCADLAEVLIKCAKRSSISSAEEMRAECAAEYNAFRECYLTKLEADYPSTASTKE